VETRGSGPAGFCLDGAGAEQRERVRQLMVGLFRDLGHEHPLSLQ
jgi:hypothetical protein